MKTTFLKIASVLLMLVAGKNSYAAISQKDQPYTGLTWIHSFYKIEVHGNVQLHLISGDKCKVEMNSTYCDHNALVQVENGVLRITCYKAEKLNVWVTTNDLRELLAYDNVLVQTEGSFSALEFNVELFNKAKAQLNLDCFTANVKLNDHSVADITGTATESELTSNYAATLNSANFTAARLSKGRINPIWETEVEFPGVHNYNILPNLSDEFQAGSSNVNEWLFSSSQSKPIQVKIPADVHQIAITTKLFN